MTVFTSCRATYYRVNPMKLLNKFKAYRVEIVLIDPQIWWFSPHTSTNSIINLGKREEQQQQQHNEEEETKGNLSLHHSE